MVIRNIYNKRPYWIDSLEDKPLPAGFEAWKNDNINTTIDKSLFKLNQINADKFELLFKPNAIKQVANYYLEILINNNTYYIYVEKLIRIANGINVYECVVDNWATYGIKLLTKLSQFNKPLLFTRGHINDNKWEFADDKLEETYTHVMGRNNKLVVESTTLHGTNRKTYPNVYAIYQRQVRKENGADWENNFAYPPDNNPYFIIPFLYNADTIGNDKGTIITFNKNTPQQSTALVHNSNFFFESLQLDPAYRMSDKLVGFFVGPNVLNIEREYLYIVRFTESRTPHYVRQILCVKFNPTEFLINGSVPNIINTMYHDTFITTPTTSEEFWKLNSCTNAKSKQILNMFDHRIGGQKIDMARMSGRTNGILDLSGVFYFNGTIKNILYNQQLNANERLFSYTPHVPSSASSYVQYIQSVYNTTNTGLQAQKVNAATNIGINGLSNLMGLFGNTLTGNVMGGVGNLLNVGANTFKTNVSLMNYKRAMKAMFNDKAAMSKDIINYSNDEELLNFYNQYENNNASITGETEWISRDIVTKNNLIALNNIITKYGWYCHSHESWSEICLNKPNTYANFSWVEIDGEFCNSILLPYFVNECNILNEMPFEKVSEFISQIIEGVRFWKTTYNNYEYSSDVFNNERWNPRGTFNPEVN